MLTLLDPKQANQAFPAVTLALSEPDGLLAVGGCLSTRRIINAYSQGIFPWYSNDDPILWWSPDPRLVIFPEKLHISKSL
ncbi:MAG: leucyl/phenylalanyl-tRNA--protein transferase, partial [Gammaproteobacteria bacterium]